MNEPGYILANANAVAATRLDVLASIFDPWTRVHLEARGLSAGWRCWEVGAGGPSTVRWLAERVGPSGHVLATDLDPRWAFFPVVHPALSLLERLTYEQVGKGLVAGGLATEAEIAQHLDNVARGLVTPLMSPLFTAWGRKT